jgi:single-stranded DNA-binding protein
MVATASSAIPGPNEGQPVPSELPPPDARPTAEREYVPRLTGRLARNPRFHTTKQGVLVAEFDLGVKDPDDPTQTTWYAVAVFGERAEKLKGAVKQGDLVEVIGSYRHLREFTGRDGKKRQKEQYYATVVKLR